MKKPSPAPQSSSNEKDITPPARRYAPPMIVEYGSIAKLTQGAGSSGGDGGSSMGSGGIMGMMF